MTTDQAREAVQAADFAARLADPGNFLHSAGVLDGIRAFIAADRASREQGDLEAGTQRAPASAAPSLLPASDSAADAGRLDALQVGTTPPAGNMVFNASSGNVIFVPVVYDPPPPRDPAEGFCGGWVERRLLIETNGVLTDSDPAADRIDLRGKADGFAAAVTSGSLSDASFDDDLGAALAGLGGGQAVWFAPDAGDHAGEIFLVVDGNGVAGYQRGEDYVFGIDGLPLADLTGPTDFFV